MKRNEVRHLIAEYLKSRDAEHCFVEHLAHMISKDIDNEILYEVYLCSQKSGSYEGK